MKASINCAELFGHLMNIESYQKLIKSVFIAEFHKESNIVSLDFWIHIEISNHFLGVFWESDDFLKKDVKMMVHLIIRRVIGQAV